MNQWKADPEKYERLSQPFDSKEEADKAAEAFFNAVAALREQYRIPDFVIQFTVNFKMEGAIVSLQGGGGFGNQLLQAKIIKTAADRELAHLFMMINQISEALPSFKKMLLTDPVAEQKEQP